MRIARLICAARGIAPVCLFALAVLSGCAQKKRTASVTPAPSPGYPQTLQGQLDRFNQQWRVSLGTERARLYDQQVEQLRASGRPLD